MPRRRDAVQRLRDQCRPAIGEALDEVIVEARRVIVEEMRDIGGRQQGRLRRLQQAQPRARAVGVAEVIFLVAPSGHLVPATREVAVPASLTQVVDALLAGPTATESAAGIQSFLSRTGVQVTLAASGGVATVHFTTDPIQVVGPDQTLAIAKVVYTVTQQPGVTGVDFAIAGKAIEVPTAAGAQVPGPVNRADYTSLAPLP